MTMDNGLREADFRDICMDARRGFQDAIDLVVIHNERDVRGSQPRTTLNPLTVLLAVAAWERFITDLCSSADGASASFSVGKAKSKPGGGYGNRAFGVLEALSGGRLPEAWNVVVFDGWRGKHPTMPRAVSGDRNALETQLERCIQLRNAVAHRALPQHAGNLDPETGLPYFKSDAKEHTIQSGGARGVLAFTLQLTDQAIVQIAKEHGWESTGLRLPALWFQAIPTRLRGADNGGPLWGGSALPR